MSKLLLVEDNREVAKIISDFLCISGYSVDTAFNIKTALELFNKNSYDFIITDENLPDRKGSYLVNQIKKKCPNLPVLGISGNSNQQAQALFSAGVDGFLTKPFTLKQLREKIHALLKKNRNPSKQAKVQL